MVTGNLAHKLNAQSDDAVHISESPVKWCSVSLSDIISSGKRLEAGAYDIEAKSAEKAITNCKYGSIRLLVDDGIIECAFHAPRFKRRYVEKVHPDAVGFWEVPRC